MLRAGQLYKCNGVCVCVFVCGLRVCWCAGRAINVYSNCSSFSNSTILFHYVTLLPLPVHWSSGMVKLQTASGLGLFLFFQRIAEDSGWEEEIVLIFSFSLKDNICRWVCLNAHLLKQQKKVASKTAADLEWEACFLSPMGVSHKLFFTYYC